MAHRFSTLVELIFRYGLRGVADSRLLFGSVPSMRRIPNHTAGAPRCRNCPGRSCRKSQDAVDTCRSASAVVTCIKAGRLQFAEQQVIGKLFAHLQDDSSLQTCCSQNCGSERIGDDPSSEDRP